jgi:hypothetical protein
VVHFDLGMSSLLYPLHRSEGVEEGGLTLRAREEIARWRVFHRPCQVHPQRWRNRDFAQPSRARPILFGAIATEAQRVIAVGADFAAIVKSRRVFSALAADVTFVTVKTTGGGWGHRPSL